MHIGSMYVVCMYCTTIKKVGRSLTLTALSAGGFEAGCGRFAGKWESTRWRWVSGHLDGIPGPMSARAAVIWRSCWWSIDFGDQDWKVKVKNIRK